MKRMIIWFNILFLFFLPCFLSAWAIRNYGDITFESFSYGEHALDLRNTLLVRVTPGTNITAGYGIRFQNNIGHMVTAGVSQTLGVFTYIQGSGTYSWVPHDWTMLNFSLSLHGERAGSAVYAAARTGFSFPGFYAGFSGGGQQDVFRFLTVAGKIFGTYHSGSMVSGAANGEVRLKPDPAVIITLGGGYRSPMVSLSEGGIFPGERGVDGYFSGKIFFSEIDSLSYVFLIQSYPFYWKYSHSLIIVFNL